MQISRHWRINSHRYQLTGNRIDYGSISIQQRPVSLTIHQATRAAATDNDQYMLVIPVGTHT